MEQFFSSRLDPEQNLFVGLLFSKETPSSPQDLSAAYKIESKRTQNWIGTLSPLSPEVINKESVDPAVCQACN